MPSKQAPRVAVNLFTSKVLTVLLFCTVLCPVLLSVTSAASQLGGTDIRGLGREFDIMVSPAQLPVATVSTPYSATLHASGGTAPYQFRFDHGTLPPGLSFNSTTGTLAGTPTTAGSYSFRIAISDLPKTDFGAVTIYITVANSSAAVVGVTVTPTSGSVASAGTLQLSAHVTNTSNTSVTWTAQGGTISSGGLFTAPRVTSASTATVTATSVADPTKTARVTINVNPVPVVAVAVTPISSSLISGAQQQFVATVSNTSNTAVSWSASSGTISSSGMFTAPNVSSASTATVTATSVADATKHAQSTVTVSPLSVSVAVTPGSTSLPSGGSLQFTATVRNTSNTAVRWSASAGTIASNGTFTAPNVLSSTPVTITATSMASTSSVAHSVVTVNPMGTITVAISPVSTSVSSAGMQQFIATVTNTSNTSVTWSASSGSISGSGLFAAPSVTSAATATIKATSVADTTKMALATVSVTPVTQGPPPPPPPPPPSTGADNTYCGTGDIANFGGTDTVATLPQACINTALANTPAPGKTTLVAAGGSIQNAINAAACGDTIQIQAGASFTGTFNLPNKSCDGQHWIIIRTSAPDSSLPAEGTRLTPCYAGVASLPDRPPYYCPSAADVMPKILAAGNQAFTTQAGASYYRLIGLEITHGPNMPAMQPDTLVAITSPTAPLPSHIIIDRCWVHGLATAFLKRGIKLDGSYLAVIDSTVTDVHSVGTATQGMLSGTGAGPLKIVNNFVEGGDSAVGFGGQGNPFGNPSDVEIRRNHLFKPWSWQYGSPTYLGYAFSAKVALESKNSNRVLIEGNIMEHTWGDAGPGTATQGGDGSIVWLGPKNQSSVCPTCDVSDITFRYNLMRHAGAGPYIFDAPSDTGALAVQAKRYSIHDNLLDDISTTYSRHGSGNGMLHRFFGTTAYLPPRDVAVFHNTGLTTGLGFLSLGGTTAPYVNFTFNNNLEIDGTYGISGCATLFGTAALASCAPGYMFTGNVIIGGKSNILSGALMPSSPTTVGFANYNNGNGGDYRLCIGPGNPVASCTAASPYINAGTDGRDIGADLNTLNTMISGVN